MKPKELTIYCFERFKKTGNVPLTDYAECWEWLENEGIASLSTQEKWRIHHKAIIKKKAYDLTQKQIKKGGTYDKPLKHFSREIALKEWFQSLIDFNIDINDKLN